MIRLVLFDIDGTLVRTGGAGVRAFERAFALEFGIDDAFRGMQFAGRTDPSLLREGFHAHGIEPSRYNSQRFFDSYVFLLEHFLEYSGGAPCSGVLEFIRDLEDLPRPPLLGLLTGNIRLGAEIKLRRYSLWDFFPFGAFGDDDEDRNRLAAMAQERGSRALGRPLAGEEILVIGDTPLDVQCARAIGARMIAVGTGSHSCEELRSCTPHWVVASLNEVRAAEVCSGPARPWPAANPPTRKAGVARSGVRPVQ